MDNTKIHDFEENIIVVTNNEKRVEIVEDEISGDWGVMDMSKEYPQPLYVLTRDDAIIYTLSILGVLEETSWDMAPDRC